VTVAIHPRTSVSAQNRRTKIFLRIPQLKNPRVDSQCIVV
jgi:hypothetical protein